MQWQLAWDISQQTARHTINAALQLAAIVIVALIVLMISTFSYGIVTITRIVDLLESLMHITVLAPLTLMLLSVPIALCSAVGVGVWAGMTNHLHRQPIQTRIAQASLTANFLVFALLLVFHQIPSMSLLLVSSVLIIMRATVLTATWYDDTYGRRKRKFEALQADFS